MKKLKYYNEGIRCITGPRTKIRIVTTNLKHKLILVFIIISGLKLGLSPQYEGLKTKAIVTEPKHISEDISMGPKHIEDLCYHPYDRSILMNVYYHYKTKI